MYFIILKIVNFGIFGAAHMYHSLHLAMWLGLAIFTLPYYTNLALLYLMRLLIKLRLVILTWHNYTCLILLHLLGAVYTIGIY